jgi:hypothetical protein
VLFTYCVVHCWDHLCSSAAIIATLRILLPRCYYVTLHTVFFLQNLRAWVLSNGKVLMKSLIEPKSILWGSAQYRLLVVWNKGFLQVATLIVNCWRRCSLEGMHTMEDHQWCLATHLWENNLSKIQQNLMMSSQMKIWQSHLYDNSAVYCDSNVGFLRITVLSFYPLWSHLISSYPFQLWRQML